MSIQSNKLMNLADGKVLYDDLRQRIEQSGSAAIDDTAGTGDTDKAWSADKLTEEFTEMEDLVVVQDTTPTENVTKVWLPATPPQSVQVPTYGEFSNLLNAIERLDNSKAPVIIDSASGAIATFPDGADGLPLESLVVDIDHVQDLHGQSAPYPAGGGKNKANVEDATGITTQTQIGTVTLPAGDYCLSAYISNSGSASVAVRITDENITTIKSTTYVTSAETRVYGTFTLAAETNCKIWVVGSAAGYNGTVKKVQIESGSSMTDFAPYSNICPITGWTGCNVTRTGKNLFDKSKLHYPTGANARYGAYGFNSYRDTVPNGELILFPGTYTLTLSGANSTNAESISVYDESNTRIKIVYNNKVCSFNVTSKGKYGIVIVIGSVNFSSWDNYDIQLESGSGTDYKPYTGQTYPVTWQSAGTVYGGTVNPVTGELVVDWINEIFDGSEQYVNYTNVVMCRKTVPTGYAQNAQSILCNYAPYPYVSFTVQTVRNSFQFSKSFFNVSTEVELKEFLTEWNTAGNPLQICYKLATPITYTLAPTEIRTLLGNNNIFADTGDVAVDYRADTRLFVEKTEVSGVQDVKVNGTSVVTDGVANLQYSGNGIAGVSKTSDYYGIQTRSTGNDIGFLQIAAATDANIKTGANANRPIVSNVQHRSVFFGLSKAAGEDLASDTVTLGTYPEKSKSAISQMLDAPETISGTTPSITAKPGVRYICGEVSTLTIVVPSSGCIDVTFDSGSTATVLTVTPPTGMTMKWANGFDPTALEANTTYEINIMDGCLGVAGSWT